MATKAMDSLHKVVTGLLAIAIVGGFNFVVETQTEIALLKQEVKQIQQMSQQILDVVEAAHPRQP